MDKLNNLIANIDTSLLSALELINKNEKGILFIVDAKQKFIGTVTDGDIRRGLINNKVLEIKLENIMSKKSFSADISTPIDTIINLLKEKKTKEKVDISVVPLLKDGEIVDFFEFKHNFHAPIASPVLDGNELIYIAECIHTNWISSQGRFVTEFENIFSKTYNSKYSVTVMNGTVAIHLALVALGIGPGDEVIVPSLTFAASINAILYTGATPVIVDVEENSWCLDPKEVEKHITTKTKAIMPVHIYGQVCDMDKIMNLAKKHNLFVVEDCAEAQGAKYKDKYVGTIGDVGCFSFFGNKIITTGEGGMCTTNNDKIYLLMKKLRDHGMNRDHRLYYHDVVGFNYRMTNIQAAVGLAQMERLSQIEESRQNIENIYHKELKLISDFRPQQNFNDRKKTVWLVSFTNESKTKSTVDLIENLKSKNIDIRPFFYPLHQMEIYSKYCKSPCPISEKLSKTGVNLPTSLAILSDDYLKVCSAIKEFFN